MGLQVVSSLWVLNFPLFIMIFEAILEPRLIVRRPVTLLSILARALSLLRC